MGLSNKLGAVLACTRHLFGVISEGCSSWEQNGYWQGPILQISAWRSDLAGRGLLATLLSLGIGVLWARLRIFWRMDWTLQSCVRELFIALPWLYLLFALRAFLPLNIIPSGFSIAYCGHRSVGWARPARLIRGVVLSGKSGIYVLAARSFRRFPLYLVRRHILPQTYSIILTQAGSPDPQYILAEVTLSFLVWV